MTDGRPTQAMFSMPEAGNVRIEITDASGTVVRVIERSNLPAGDHLVDWDGAVTGGGAAADGDYAVRVTYTSGAQAGSDAPVYNVGRIRAVRFVGGNPVIVIDGKEYYLSALVEVMDGPPGEGV